MINRENVIHGLQEIYDEAYDRWVHTQYTTDKLVTLVSEVVPNALALLREQEPVEPRWTHPTVDKNVMMCGSCGIEIPLGKPNYCPWCGKKVKYDA